MSENHRTPDRPDERTSEALRRLATPEMAEVLRLLPEDPGDTFDLSVALPQTAAHPADRIGTDPVPGTPVDPPAEAALPPGGPMLLRVLGRGGFGEVWEAIDPTLGRLVALKRIRPDLLERVAGNRRERRYQRLLFFREALATARLEHPNIVPVHQYLEDADGNPQLSMKRVRGAVWEDLLEEDFARLDANDYFARHLPVLIAVAQAVAFAHSRGVIHRDLKPAQVMVGEYGEVLLMDWGLAMVFDPMRFLEEESQGFCAPMPFTAETAANPSGTPAFMAPEQTVRETTRLGPATDIFLLGGMLYFLLTAMPPHSGDKRTGVFMKAMLCEVPHPRTRVPEGRAVPEQLAYLAMWCLRPEPQHRPATAAEFIAALQDYLTGAGKRRESQQLVEDAERELPAAREYRALGDLVARLGNARALWPENPRIAEVRDRVLLQYAELALRNGDLVLAQVQAERLGFGSERAALQQRINAGFAATRRRDRQRRGATAAAVTLSFLLVAAATVFSARQRAARLEIERASDALRQQRDQGNALLSFVVRDLGEALEPAGRLDLLRDVAERSRAYYENLPAADQPEELLNRALAFRQIGDVFAAENRIDDAFAAYARALALIDARASAGAAVGDTLAERAEVELRRAGLLRRRGDTAASDTLVAQTEAALRAGIGVEGAPPRLTEILARTLILRSNAFPSRGTIEDAIAAAEEARSLVEAGEGNATPQQLRIAAEAAHEVADKRRFQGKLAEAVAAFQAEADSWREATRQDPRDAVALRGLAGASDSLGAAYFDLGDFETALSHYRAQLALREALSQRDPLNMEWRQDLAWAHNAVAFIHHWRGEFEDALSHYRTADNMFADLILQDPLNTTFRARRTSTLNNVGSVLTFLGRPAEAVPYYERMRGILEDLLRQDPNHVEWQRMLAMNHGKLGLAHEAFGRLREAEQEHRANLEMAQRIAAADPTNIKWRDSLAGAHTHLGMVLADMGRTDEALEHFLAADRERESIAATIPPESMAALRNRANSEGYRYEALLESGRLEEAEALAEGLFATCRTLVERAPDDLGDQLRLANVEHARVRARLRRGIATPEDSAAMDGILAKLAALRARHPEHRGLRVEEASALLTKAELCGNAAEAESLRDRALATQRPLTSGEDPAGSVQFLRMLVRLAREDEATSVAARLREMGYDEERLQQLLRRQAP